MTNKNDSRLQRKHIRAPLKSACLYVDGEHVFKARVLNISEGGILLSDLPHIPEINSLPLAIDLLQFPRMQTLTYEQVKELKIDEFPRFSRFACLFSLAARSNPYDVTFVTS